MKLTKQQLEELTTRIADVVTENGPERVAAHIAKILKDDRVKNLAKRFRWDLFWATDREWRTRFMDDFYNSGGNDKHLDTGLKAAIRNIGALDGIITGFDNLFRE